MNIETICNDLYKTANEIYSELGCGFNEAVLQNAPSIELRENVNCFQSGKTLIKEYYSQEASTAYINLRKN